MVAAADPERQLRRERAVGSGVHEHHQLLRGRFLLHGHRDHRRANDADRAVGRQELDDRAEPQRRGRVRQRSRGRGVREQHRLPGRRFVAHRDAATTRSQSTGTARRGRSWRARTRRTRPTTSSPRSRARRPPPASRSVRPTTARWPNGGTARAGRSHRARTRWAQPAVRWSSISCPAVTRCTAAGVVFKSNNQQRLVEVLTPQNASVVGVPVPSDTKRSSLSGVSCATVTSCFAVGDYRRGPSRRPLLLRYS